MITGNNNSKPAASGEFIDVKKYVGVASVKVLAVNPKNSTLRKYGWTIDESADEPKYIFTADDGTQSTRVRFLVEIQDIEPKPVISLDFWIRDGFVIGKKTGKCRVIDSFGRVAWATKDEAKAHKIPQYTSGPAEIANDYKGCHPGQDKLIAFLFKYLNVTPFMKYDKNKQEWVREKNPGQLTIDNWKNLVAGDMTEVMEFLSLEPDNCVKVVLGVKTTEENRTYQTFLDDCDGTRTTPYIGNNVRPDKTTGEYSQARKRIDAFYKDHTNSSNVIFSALPVKEWSESATSVEDNSGKMFDADGNYIADDDDLPVGDANDDLPFAD